MKLGIKVSPRNNSLEDIQATNPDFTEVWFHHNKKDEYTNLFAILKKLAPDSGLHFWGSLSDGSLATIAYPDKAVVHESMTMIQDTIDIAAKNSFSYVNIHPGTRVRVNMNFETETFTIHGPYANFEAAEQQFLENAITLHAYAKARGVLLTVETVPRYSSNGWRTRSERTPVDIGDLPLTALYTAAKHSIAIANDFSHTTAAGPITTDKQILQNHLIQTTIQLASATRLIHIGFLFPPFNGTESHDSLANPIFQTSDAIPNKNCMIELFKHFVNRPDVRALVEPKNDHVGNYFLAKKLLEESHIYP